MSKIQKLAMIAIVGAASCFSAHFTWKNLDSPHDPLPARVMASGFVGAVGGGLAMVIMAGVIAFWNDED